MSSVTNIPSPANEPVLAYAPGSAERKALKDTLRDMAGVVEDIPVVIGGEERRGEATTDLTSPHRHRHVLGRVHQADRKAADDAARAAVAAQREWASWKFEDRAAIFLKAADRLAGAWRPVLNAATMLGQSKTVFQAEIDSACELIDFLRFNVHFAEKLYQEQPASSRGIWNRMEHRPLEGFIYAITPFNFTAIGGNLPTAPAILGNTVVWKPAATAALSNWHFFRLLRECGLPDGVINFVPGPAAEISDVLLAHRDLAGIHFTGSTPVFRSFWKTVGENIATYRSYPRLVGETGGKDFVLAHPSADVNALAVGLVRGAFEYQGQKCSAASRAYIPKSLWPGVRKQMLGLMESITMGDVADFRHFMGAVIDQKAFRKISGYLKQAAKDPGVTIVAGGGADDREGWFIEPTLIQTEDPSYTLMCEEIFGPVLTVYVYPDRKWTETLALVDSTSPYALTGSVFAQDRAAVAEASRALVNAAGNFYVNDKPTGAVVGQQPFGGARASGTNDKAGSILNLMRWVSPRSIKETFEPPVDHRYPFMQAE
ncbi:MAG TPA: L-glutamate gamma-semialdehyde dehydrogenase [Gemmatimonadales bacterium]|jgi:1-pyrroline-5-carboxylate dehydrogenase|nr:L-glutamate gamma-semialdehyde dehydrogenase [Gemmatimonadales bacterium]